MQEEKRTWGQIRADKERRPKEAKGDPVPPADGILDVRICFRASTAIRDLSWQVHRALGMTQGEFYRAMLFEKAEELGPAPEELATGRQASSELVS